MARAKVQKTDNQLYIINKDIISPHFLKSMPSTKALMKNISDSRKMMVAYSTRNGRKNIGLFWNKIIIINSEPSCSRPKILFTVDNPTNRNR